MHSLNVHPWFIEYTINHTVLYTTLEHESFSYIQKFMSGLHDAILYVTLL
jgi:hypothetical protein